MRVRLTVEYDGTNYCGWQKQDNGITIQGVLESELSKLTSGRVTLHGAGRTDSGVHALGQVAHFDTDSRIPPEKFSCALNSGLPGDIRVSDSRLAPCDFHARFDAVAKHYRYRIRVAPHASALYRNFELHVHDRLDIEAMRAAAKLVEGEQDFASFMAAGSNVSETVRNVYKSSLTVCNGIIEYDIIGNGFLYNMVRIIVGTLLLVGKASLPPGHIAGVIGAKSRAAAADTAPAKGLTLVKVYYGEDEPQFGRNI